MGTGTHRLSCDGGVMSFKLSQLGFSMMEGIVGMGLLGGVAVLGMKLTDMSSSSRGSQESKINSQALTSQIKGYLDNVDACRITLGGIDATTGGTITEIKNKVGSIMFTTGKKYDGVTLVSLSLLPPNPANGSYINLPARLGFVDLMAKLKGKESAGGIEVTKKLRVWIMTQAAGSGVIAKCSSTSPSNDTVWSRSYWDASNIFYDGALVGTGGPVGSNTQTLLVSNGKLQASTEDDKKIQIESAAGSASFKIRAMNNIPVAFTNSETANYADLSVAGLIPNSSIRVGERPGPCTGTILGTIRFNPNINRVQVCSRVETTVSVATAGTTCVRYSSPEPQYKVTYTPDGGGPTIDRFYDKPDPGNPVDEPGEPVVDPLIDGGLTYRETSRTDFTPPVTCIEYDESFSAASAPAFKWISAQ